MSFRAQWLELYRSALLNADADGMAKLFHPGFSYIVNDEYNTGSPTFHQPQTWKHIFEKVSYTGVKAGQLHEPAPGHLFYEEEIRLTLKDTKESLIGNFKDEVVVDEKMRMVLILRKADPMFFEKLYAVLAPGGGRITQ